MSPKDFLLALVIVLAWGVNFVVIRVGLDGMPPMLLGAVRFALAAFPAILFIKRPQISWYWLFAYGLTISFCQFAFLFSAMYVGMPAGLASLVLQAQALFTFGFAVVFLREKFRPQNIIGLVIAAGGLMVIGLKGGHAMTIAGFLLTMCAAASWALGNIVLRKIGRVDLLGLVVWGSLIPPLPFMGLSLLIEGPHQVAMAFVHISMLSILAVLYLAFIATLLGYSLWGHLLSRYPATQVAPFSLLVPIVGLISAAVLLGERWSVAEIIGAILVMAGLVVNTFGGWLLRRLTPA